MTVVIAYIDGNAIVIGCDSCVTEGDFTSIRGGGIPKIWEIFNGEECIVVGFAGNCSELSFVRHAFKWPSRLQSQSIENWLVESVQPELSHAFRKRFKKYDADYQLEWEMIMLIKPGRIFRLSQCGDVEESVELYNAIGSGRHVALGALASLDREAPNLVSWEKVQVALNVCEKYHSSVRKPFHLHALV